MNNGEGADDDEGATGTMEDSDEEVLIECILSQASRISVAAKERLIVELQAQTLARTSEDYRSVNPSWNPDVVFSDGDSAHQKLVQFMKRRGKDVSPSAAMERIMLENPQLFDLRLSKNWNPNIACDGPLAIERAIYVIEKEDFLAKSAAECIMFEYPDSFFLAKVPACWNKETCCAFQDRGPVTAWRMGKMRIKHENFTAISCIHSILLESLDAFDLEYNPLWKTIVDRDPTALERAKQLIKDGLSVTDAIDQLVLEYQSLTGPEKEIMDDAESQDLYLPPDAFLDVLDNSTSDKRKEDIDGYSVGTFTCSKITSSGNKSLMEVEDKENADLSNEDPSILLGSNLDPTDSILKFVEDMSLCSESHNFGNRDPKQHASREVKASMKGEKGGAARFDLPTSDSKPAAVNCHDTKGEGDSKPAVVNRRDTRGESDSKPAAINRHETRGESDSKPAAINRHETRGVKDLPGREGFNKLKRDGRLDAIISMVEGAEAGSQYKNSDRLFLLRIKKVYQCFALHCGRDKNTFFQKHPGNIYPTPFACRECGAGIS